jgi:hypothetical protein
MFIALFPLMLFLYRKVTDSLVDLGKLQANITGVSITSTNLGEWYVFFIFYFLYFVTLLYSSFVVPNNSTAAGSPHDAILALIKYYIILGFLSILLFWMAWSSWIMAAERQIRRIRCVIIPTVK